MKCHTVKFLPRLNSMQLFKTSQARERLYENWKNKWLWKWSFWVQAGADDRLWEKLGRWTACRRRPLGGSRAPACPSSGKNRSDPRSSRRCYWQWPPSPRPRWRRTNARKNCWCRARSCRGKRSWSDGSAWELKEFYFHNKFFCFKSKFYCLTYKSC